jgi:hypothetical protein
MTVDQRTDLPDAREIAALWTGLLLPPAAFLLNLEVAYALVPVACSSGATLPVHLVHLGCLILALVGGVFAWRCWRATGSTWSGEEGGRLGRSRFMAGLGLLVSALFALVIVAQWIPSFLLSPCQ